MPYSDIVPIVYTYGNSKVQVYAYLVPIRNSIVLILSNQIKSKPVTKLYSPILCMNRTLMATVGDFTSIYELQVILQIGNLGR